jgi:hypothetical protein
MDFDHLVVVVNRDVRIDAVIVVEELLLESQFYARRSSFTMTKNRR